MSAVSPAPSVLVATAVLAGWAALAFGGRLLVGPEAATIDLGRVWCAPAADRWLGCDQLGRDVLGRLVLSAWASLAAAVPAAGLAILLGGGLGIAAGMTAGTPRGWLDAVVNHATEVALAFPRLMLALAMGVALTPGLTAVVAAFALAGWPLVARPTRAQVIALRRDEFLRAARALGAATPHILHRHLVPHLWSVWLARAGGLVAQAILLEAALSFLDLGVREPQPSWGGMIRDGLPALRQAPAMALSAGLAIFLVAWSANVLADDIGRRLDPRRGRGGQPMV